jgi:hypothetical protein
MTDADAWRRLGAMLIQRRTALDPRFHNRGAFCEATGLKYRLVYDIEEARRTNFGTAILAAVEAAYQLPAGAIGRFLSGSEPGILPQVTAVPEPPRRDRELPVLADPDEAGLRPFTDSVHADLAEAVRKYGPGFTPGQAFADPDEALVWDDPDGFLAPKERVRLIARFRRLSSQLDARERRTGLVSLGVRGW